MTSDGSSVSGPAPAAEPSLQGRSVKGTAVTMVFQGCKMLVQIGSVVARRPGWSRRTSSASTPWRCRSMSSPLLFQDSGTTQAIIQRELTKVDLNNIFWFNLAVCGTIVLLLALAAPFIALFYNTPVVAQLVWGFCGRDHAQLPLGPAAGPADPQAALRFPGGDRPGVLRAGRWPPRWRSP